MAEAKGRTGKVAFHLKSFQDFRDQFQRVVLYNQNGLVGVKGFIVVAKLSSENDPEEYSNLFIEDPNSPGEVPPEGSELGIEWGRSIVAGHYAAIADALMMPHIAYSLRNNDRFEDDVRMTARIFECRIGPAKGHKFVAVFLDNWHFHPFYDRQYYRDRRLFGLEYGMFMQIHQVATAERRIFDNLPKFEIRGPSPGG